MKNKLTLKVSRLLSLFPLYGILDNRFENFSMLKQAEMMLNLGVRIIQYRNKEISLSSKIEEAFKIKKLFEGRDAILIINDDINICKVVDADGVHLGQGDHTPTEARQILKQDKIVGLSTHNQFQALRALSEPIDYIGVGPVFPTTTKDFKELAGLEFVRFCSRLNIPKVAIGGITVENYEKVITAGIKNVCSIADLLKNKEEMKGKVSFYKERFEQF